jgi:RNA polymerase sigma-70 factor, ECF subfamily
MTPSGGSFAALEQSLVEAACSGDEDAFRDLVEGHRSELAAHCYRMLGSHHDAEDALQDTLIRAWRGLAGFQRGRPFRPWLYKIATNVCLDTLAHRPKRALPTDLGMPAGPGDDAGAPPAEPVWLEPYPSEVLRIPEGVAGPEARYERREAVELAFVAALQLLPARQRAALILRDVLGFSAAEVAGALETTPASVNSALQRARETIERRLPARSQQATLRALGDERVRALVDAYVRAWETADVDALAAMLAEDARLAMPPFPNWWRGRDTIAAVLTHPDSPFREPWRYVPTHANGQLAAAAYLWNAGQQSYEATGLDVLTLADDRIVQITAFATPEIFARFGLPARL